ncbi:hypothetical protein AW729_03220 [Methanosphaera sp. BMS]|nr:hypothetical protein AW729_03220 [Methanosphaera sp. BMS]
MIYDMNELDIRDNLNFIIRYCDFYMDYCHDENLSIDGDLAGEILDSIYIIEHLSQKDAIDEDEIKSLYESIDEIYENLISINDITLFNNIHLVFTHIINKTKDKLKQRCMSIE